MKKISKIKLDQLSKVGYVIVKKRGIEWNMNIICYICDNK